MAKLLVKPGNFMVMDEPTNHLDLASSEILIDALRKYDGTLLFVSHNQSFINRLATKIWDIRDKEVVEYPGNLHEYYDHLARIEDRSDMGESFQDRRGEGNSTEESPSRQGSTKKREERKAGKRARAEKRREIQETLKPILSELERVEERIAELESRRKVLEGLLSDAELFKDKKKSVPLLQEYRQNKQDLDTLLAAWEKGQGELETTKNRLGI